MSWGTFGEVWDESGDPPRGPALFGGPSGRCETSWGTLGEVQNGSGHPPRGPGQVGGPSV